MFKFLKSGFDKVKRVLEKTGAALGNRLRLLFKGDLDSDALEEIEKLFYEADFGVQTAIEMVERVRVLYRENPKRGAEDLLEALSQELIVQMRPPQEMRLAPTAPTVILIVGVNGNGKTTSVAKLAKKYHDEGKQVLVAAADTFRAAAVDQLATWAERIGVDIVRGASGSDPAAVAFDGVAAGIARQSDLVIIDTAGRLQTKTELMRELEKIKRVCNKALPGAPHETLLVIDATTGQNAIDQARLFHQSAPITGLILTKLDGTAKGGIVVAIQRALGVPVRFIGLGEDMDDLEPFDPETFVQALFS